MLKQKRGQAALEFLSTYAFVFIAVSTAIGALYYFGLLDFSKYLPQKCVFPSQFKCRDFGLTSSPAEVKFKLINDIGEDVNITSISITNNANPPISCIPNSTSVPIGWKASTEKDLTFRLCTGGAYNSNQRAELSISIGYYAHNSPAKTNHTIKGKINGRVN